LDIFCRAGEAWPLLEQKDVNSSFGVKPSFLKSTALFFSTSVQKTDKASYFLIYSLGKKKDLAQKR
jgi:hypothetical protein